MLEKIEEILASLKGQEVTVLSVLIEIQERLGYLPDEAMAAVAELTGASINDAYGVATFYTHFRFEPPGEHVIEICWGASCHVLGAPKIFKAVQEELGMDKEGTTSDTRFTWKRTSCAAACAQAPVVILDDGIYGRLTEAKVKELLSRLNGHR